MSPPRPSQRPLVDSACASPCLAASAACMDDCRFATEAAVDLRRRPAANAFSVGYRRAGRDWGLLVVVVASAMGVVSTTSSCLSVRARRPRRCSLGMKQPSLGGSRGFLDNAAPGARLVFAEMLENVDPNSIPKADQRSEEIAPHPLARIENVSSSRKWPTVVKLVGRRGSPSLKDFDLASHSGP